MHIIKLKQVYFNPNYIKKYLLDFSHKYTSFFETWWKILNRVLQTKPIVK